MGFESKFDDCTVVLEPMTKNTFLLLVSVDPRIGEWLVPRYTDSSRNRDGPVQPPSGSATYIRIRYQDGPRPEMRVSPTVVKTSPQRLKADSFSLCRNNTELRYEVKGDDSPDVPAWDDAGQP